MCIYLYVSNKNATDVFRKKKSKSFLSDWPYDIYDK